MGVGHDSLADTLQGLRRQVGSAIVMYYDPVTAEPYVKKKDCAVM